MESSSHAAYEPQRSIAHATTGQDSSRNRPELASGTNGRIVRDEVPPRIPLSPLRYSRSLQPTPTATQGGSSPSGTMSNTASPSPLLHWANELPDDPVQASHVMHLYPSSLAPAFSPGQANLPPHSESSQSIVSQSRSPYFSGLGLQSGQNPLPQTPSRLMSPAYSTTHQRVSPEPNIFERAIEPMNRARSPQTAIDEDVPTVLDDAANAIVEDSTTLEILQPDTSSQGLSPPRRSPSVRLRSSHIPSPIGAWTPTRTPARRRSRNLSGGHAMGENASDPRSNYQQHYGRQRGHRRPLSDASNVFTSLPMHTNRAEPERTGNSLGPPTPLTPHARSLSMHRTASPSLSVDGAIIPENDAATMNHSLDGLADAFASLAASPSEIQPVIQTPGSISSVQGSYFALSPGDHTTRVRDRPTSFTSPSAIRYQVLESDRELHPASTRTPSQARAASTPLAASTSGSHRASPRIPSSAGLAPPIVGVPPIVHPGDTANTSGDRKRLSFMAYADIKKESAEQLVDLDESVQLQMRHEQEDRSDK
ncbi:hypothetical protein MYAM1_000150 [Malassezia yamatoensis]|uniref:Uncharacterized protein n=1 Tax=Malassezia yamatoensis TaxID=253288 RepID=A0AAJ6CEN6_9BASI|nr:hypothetical protein MYAM1_000150 [Malassezia yamatoensis]